MASRRSISNPSLDEEEPLLLDHDGLGDALPGRNEPDDSEPLEKGTPFIYWATVISLTSAVLVLVFSVVSTILGFPESRCFHRHWEIKYVFARANNYAALLIIVSAMNLYRLRRRGRTFNIFGNIFVDGLIAWRVFSYALAALDSVLGEIIQTLAGCRPQESPSPYDDTYEMAKEARVQNHRPCYALWAFCFATFTYATIHHILLIVRCVRVYQHYKSRKSFAGSVPVGQLTFEFKIRLEKS